MFLGYSSLCPWPTLSTQISIPMNRNRVMYIHCLHFFSQAGVPTLYLPSTSTVYFRLQLTQAIFLVREAVCIVIPLIPIDHLREQVWYSFLWSLSALH